MRRKLCSLFSIFIVTNLYCLEDARNIKDEVKKMHRDATRIKKNVQSTAKDVVNRVGDSAQGAFDGIKEGVEKVVAVVTDYQNEQELNMIESLLEAASRRCEAYQSSLKDQHDLTELVKITTLCTAIKVALKIAHTMN